MQKLELDKFSGWFRSRRKNNQRVKGEKFSEITLKRYLKILEKVPSIPIENYSYPIDVLKEYQKFIDEKAKFSQFVFAIRTYLRMLEEENIDHRFAIKMVRTGIKKPQPSKSVEGNENFFMSKTLTKKEIRYIINSIDPEKKKLILLIQLAYDTGCRPIELSSIDIENIDTKNREIIIKGKGGYVRIVNYEQSTENQIIDILDNKNSGSLLDWSVSTIENYTKKAMVLAGDKCVAGIKDKKRIRKILKKYRKMSYYWIRHSRASHLAIVWKDNVRLKDYMGWSRISLADIYVNVTSRLLKRLSEYKSTDLWED